jgi:hypothetical protein
LNQQKKVVLKVKRKIWYRYSKFVLLVLKSL